jgi:hypothetical protein
MLGAIVTTVLILAMALGLVYAVKTSIDCEDDLDI